jgi:hypothetical protein
MLNLSLLEERTLCETQNGEEYYNDEGLYLVALAVPSTLQFRRKFIDVRDLPIARKQYEENESLLD